MFSKTPTLYLVGHIVSRTLVRACQNFSHSHLPSVVVMWFFSFLRVGLGLQFPVYLLYILFPHWVDEPAVTQRRIMSCNFKRNPWMHKGVPILIVCCFSTLQIHSHCPMEILFEPHVLKYAVDNSIHKYLHLSTFQVNGEVRAKYNPVLVWFIMAEPVKHLSGSLD